MGRSAYPIQDEEYDTEKEVIGALGNLERKTHGKQKKSYRRIDRSVSYQVH